MKRLLLTTVLALFVSPLLLAQEQSDKKTFEITPAAPPVPALKYQLLFDNWVARRPGNASIFYFRALMFQNDALNKKIDDALDAYKQGDLDAFRKADVNVNRTATLNELDLAARCTDCDWQDPLREFGFKTLLPQLGPTRYLDRWLKIRGYSKVLDGKNDEALTTARLGYEMSRKVAVEPTLISGLVSLSMVSDMDDVLVKVMNSPQSPNLYWALRQFPAQKLTLQRDTSLERLGSAWAIPQLAAVLDDQEISPAQWREAYATIRDVAELNKPTTKPARNSDPATRPADENDYVRATSPEILQQARTQYAKNHELPAADANNIDPTQAVGEFYFLTFVNEYDELYKLAGLPYPQLLQRTEKFESETWKQFKAEQPANPFAQIDLGMHKATMRFAFIDRQLAAMTTVQAISAYAASHNNQLPANLNDITETPVPENPETGLAFEYKVDGDHATLSDSKSAEPLEYTITLRK
jgi:hypothetical protein